MASPQELAIELLLTVDRVHYCQLAATLVAIYDHICTLDVEYEYVWRRKWSWSKLLFFGIRYFGESFLIFESILFLNTRPTQKFCFWGFTFMPVGSSIMIWLCQAILQLRIYALYRNNIRIKIPLICLYLAQIGGMIYTTAVTQMVFTVVNEPMPGIFVCAVYNTPPQIGMYWVSVVGFESVLFLLAIWVVIHDFWRLKVFRSLHNDSILQVILRDSIVYFFVAFAAYVTTAVMWIRFPTIHPELSACFTQAATTMLGSRLVLNLSQAHYEGFETESSLWSTSRDVRSLRWNHPEPSHTVADSDATMS